MDLAAQASGIGALADETRRALYGYVAAQPEMVGREEAASALGLALHTASFHLDRLVDEGLLEVEYRRLTGRRGPGAGRPSKLYRRAAREFDVSLPPRRYDLVGAILAEAVDGAGRGTPLEKSLDRAARDEGLRVGAAAGEPGRPAAIPDLADVLAGHGYEPRVGEDRLTLANCPFDALAQRHTALVCGLNKTFVQGVADGIGCVGAEAELDPRPDRCCVAVRQPDDQPSTQ